MDINQTINDLFERAYNEGLITGVRETERIFYLQDFVLYLREHYDLSDELLHQQCTYEKFIIFLDQKYILPEPKQNKRVATPFEKLDAILGFYARTDLQNDFIPAEYIVMKINNEFDKKNIEKINNRDFFLVIEKLKEDCYLTNIPKGIARVTIAGQAFNLSGGYSDDFDRRNLDIRIARRNERLLRRYTFWLAVGTCVAAAYFLIDIYRFFYSLCNPHISLP